MKKVLYYLDYYFEEAILSCFVAYFVFATALQVFARLVLKVSMPWTEETARYTLIWMTFLGSSFAAKRGTHIRVDILETSIHKGRGIVRVISYAIFLVFTVVMTVSFRTTPCRRAAQGSSMPTTSSVNNYGRSASPTATRRMITRNSNTAVGI